MQQIRYKNILNKFPLIFLIGLLVSDCSKDFCKGENRGIYIYPEKPVGITFPEALELYKIPENTVRCIYTKELFQTCLSYPEIRMLWSQRSLQEGFDYVKGICNGFTELLSRSDGYLVIVNNYKKLNIKGNWDLWTDLEIGNYMNNIVQHEVFLAQDEILKRLTPAQKIELLKLTLDNQKLKSDLNEYYGTTGMESSLAILSRILYNDNYKPFMEQYANNELLRIQTSFMKILDPSLVGLVTNLSEEYLKLL